MSVLALCPPHDVGVPTSHTGWQVWAALYADLLDEGDDAATDLMDLACEAANLRAGWR